MPNRPPYTPASTPSPSADEVPDPLPPGTIWLPAPSHTLPTLAPGQPAMQGYLVLVPAGDHAGVRAGEQAGEREGEHDGGRNERRPSPPVREPVHEPGPDTASGPATGPAPGHGAEAPAEDGAGDREGPVRIDVSRRTAEVGGRRLDLTYLEFELLAHLVAHPHRVHTRDQLVAAVWPHAQIRDGRTVDVHIARVRRKLGPDQRGAVQTVRSVGYKYVPDWAEPT
ncbi:winged helix-turn-helix domain-containing protein [Streptomyces sp. NPDC087420]|uniref:winged helix-turn-helix domain-containing protein n=1 Tax=Streptomyces sp. NPDC087420 TaxID=3365785 RepID=UPI00383277AD